MTSAEILRFQMSDRPHFANEVYFGDGTASAFQMSGFPMITGCANLGGQNPTVTIRSDTEDSWSGTALAATGLLFGMITFASPIPYGVPFQVGYTYAAFSDQDIDYFTANAPGDLNGQKLKMIDTLLTDYVTRARWNAQGVSVDDHVVFENLLKLRETLWKQMTVEQGPLGGVESWAVQQQYNP